MIPHIALEGIRRRVGRSAGHQCFGEMRTRHKGRWRLRLNQLPGDGKSHGLELSQHAQITVFTALPQVHQAMLEGGVLWVHKEPQHVKGSPQESAAQFDPGDQSCLHVRLLPQESWQAV